MYFASSDAAAIHFAARRITFTAQDDAAAAAGFVFSSHSIACRPHIKLLTGSLSSWLAELS